MKIHFNLRVCSQTSAQNIWYIRRCIYATHEMKSILVKMVGLPSQELLTAEWEGVERERPWLRPRGGSGTAQSIWSVQTQYAALWVLLKCVLQRISSSQSITCFSIVTLIFWFFFSFSIAFFLWLLAVVVLGHTTQIRDFHFSEKLLSLRNWHLILSLYNHYLHGSFQHCHQSCYVCNSSALDKSALAFNVS